MKLLFCASVVSAFFISCDSFWTTRYPYTTAGPGVNLKGKMVTLSQYSGVTFSSPYYRSASGSVEGEAPPTTTARPEGTTEGTTRRTTGWTTRRTTGWTTRRTTGWTTTRTTGWTTRRTTGWTTPYYTTTPSPTSGVSVCLRFMTDSGSFNLFKLAPGSPLALSWRSPGWYSLSSSYYTQISLSPRISLWSSVRTQPWTSVCVVLDSVKNVVQLFQGGSMSVRKIPPSRMFWSGEPVLDVSGFDGQVTDLEVWDYPLKYGQIYSYMQNYGSSGTVLSWSNIAYRYRGDILFEDTYALQQKQSIEGPEQPITSKQRRGQKLKYRKMFNGKRQRNQTL